MSSIEEFILNKLRYNHESTEAQSFSIPSEAHLISFSKVNGATPWYGMFELKNYQKLQVSDHLVATFMDTIDQFASHETNYKVGAEVCKQKIDFFPWQGTTTLCIVPLNLLTQPKAFMLFPEQNAFSDNFKYAEELSLILERSMFDYFFKHYTVEKLKKIESSHQLVEDFAREVAQWLCPNSYLVYGEKYPYLSHTQYNAKFSFQSNTTEEPENRIEYFIRVSPSKPMGNVYYETRRLALQNSLELFFEHLYSYWQSITQDNHIHVFKKTLSKIEELIVELDQYKNLLNNIIQNSAQPPRVSRSFEFAFFEKNGLWQVYFDGKPFIKKSTSEKGMLAIHILLKNPEQKFNPRTLYKEVNQLGKTSSAKKEEIYLENAHMKQNNQEFAEYKNLWIEWFELPDNHITKDQFYTLIDFLKCIILKKAYTKGSDVQDLIGLENQLEKKVNMVNRLKGFSDELFQKPPVMNYRTERMDKDVLYQNISKALNDFKDTQLYQYFSKTLIYKTTDGNKPFIFKPSFIQHDQEFKVEWRNASWLTEDIV